MDLKIQEGIKPERGKTEIKVKDINTGKEEKIELEEI